MKKYNNVYTKKNNKEVVKMEKNDIMADAINDFILDDDFLRRFIIDNVEYKIYSEQSYNTGMIESVLTTDLFDNTDSYILGHILEEIDIWSLIDKIDEKYGDDFHRLARQTQQR